MKIRLAGFALVFCLTAISASSQEVLVDPDPKGYASGVIGEVLVLEPEASAPRPLADSEAIFEGSRITVGENAFVEIDLLDGSEIKIDEMSQVDLAEISAAPETMDRQINLSMLYGSLRATVEKGFSEKSVFRVTTPVAVAGVRGTEFAVDYESDDVSTVDVFDGEVAVSAEGDQEAPVSAGESAEAGRGRGVRRKAMAADRQDRWEHFRESMTHRRQEMAESNLREKIATLQAADPADPRLSGLENALAQVSQDRAAAKARREEARDRWKNRRSERVEKMREFSKQHAREKFEHARKFRGGALSPSERRAAAEKLRARRSDLRHRAGERHRERRQNIQERREQKQEKHQERRENLKDRRENKREQMQDRKERHRNRRNR